MLSCEKLWQMKSVEAYNISGTDPEDDFRIMGYVTVESAVAMGEEHNANLDAATHLNLIGNIYFTSVSDIVFDDITLKSGEKMDGEEAFALAVEKMREANPDGKLIVTFLGNKDLTGDGLEIEDRHNEAMGEHKDKLIAGIVAVVKKYSLDGVSFDYEYPHKLARRGGRAARRYPAHSRHMRLAAHARDVHREGPRSLRLCRGHGVRLFR